MLHSAVVRCAKNLAVVGVLSLTAHIAAAQSFQIGSSNTVTADPPVSRPHVKPCVVTLFAGLQFVDFSIPTYQYQPPFGAGAPASSGAAASGPTSMGLQPNIAAGLSYIGLWITGLIFFLLEKQNRFVRFHAMQSILFFGGISVLNIILGIAGGYAGSFLGLGLGCLSFLIGLAGFIGWLVLMINAFQGKYFKLPVIGDYAERYANQGM